MAFDPVAMKLDAQYKKGFLPPQMGAQLYHPRQLLAYDTFERGPGVLGKADSGQEWVIRQGNLVINAGSPGIVVSTQSTSIATIDIGGRQDQWTVSALLTSYRGSGNRHGVVVAYVDSQNYITVNTYANTLRIEKTVAGVTTVVATKTKEYDIRYNDIRWEWVTASLLNMWGESLPYIRATTSVGNIEVAYRLSEDPDAQTFAGSMIPGIYLTSAGRCSRFYVVNERSSF